MRSLLLSPVRPVFNNTFRLPPIQEPTQAIARNLRETLMDRDALRRIKTTARQSRILSGSIPSPQGFTTAAGGGSNDPAAMASGAHKMNARRLVNKVASSRTAGM